LKAILNEREAKIIAWRLPRRVGIIMAAGQVSIRGNVEKNLTAMGGNVEIARVGASVKKAVLSILLALSSACACILESYA
jgi:GTP:adenosylcobinamide-phosphate guanylyltransferase